MAAPVSNGGTPKAMHTAALSSKILNMRFMQKAHERDLQEQLHEQQRRIDDESQWVLPSRDRMLAYANDVNSHNAKRRRVIESETSYLPFSKTPVNGRQSFQNFSKQLEEEANKADIPPEVDLPNMPKHAPTMRYMKPAVDAATKKARVRKEPKVEPEQLEPSFDEEISKPLNDNEHDDDDIIQGARKKTKKRRAESVDSESTANSDAKQKRKKKKAASFIKAV